MKDFIEVHTWNDTAPWMVRTKSISRLTREKSSNRAIIVINDSLTMECVETYDCVKEQLMQKKKKKMSPYEVFRESEEDFDDD